MSGEFIRYFGGLLQADSSRVFCSGIPLQFLIGVTVGADYFIVMQRILNKMLKIKYWFFLVIIN